MHCPKRADQRRETAHRREIHKGKFQPLPFALLGLRDCKLD
jgi:hypothetical protein